MGFLGLFGGGADKSKTKVDKLAKKLRNPYVQSNERLRVMGLLAEIGTEDALLGLLQRFTYRTDVTIVDEDEKQQAYQLLIHAGEAALGPIETFITESDAVYWPLQAVREIAGLDAAVDKILCALERAEGRDIRVNDVRAQLVSNLRDLPHPRVEERLRELCADPVEEVRVMAIDGLMTYGEKKAAETIAGRILNSEETPRVKTVVFEALVDNGWSLGPWQAQIEEAEVIPPQYRFGGGGRIVRAG